MRVASAETADPQNGHVPISEAVFDIEGELGACDFFQVPRDY